MLQVVSCRSLEKTEMPTHLSKSLFALVIAVGSVSCTRPNVSVPLAKPNALLGSWDIQEVHWVSPDGTRSMVPAQTGILLVNRQRYSLMWTTIPTPRVPFKTLASPTDAETKAGFNSIAFNAGTYEITDSTFTTTALIAKVPGFEGGRQFFRYQLQDEKLTLTMVDEMYPNGSKPAWSGKLEAKLVLKRIE